jgi:MFS family permease
MYIDRVSFSTLAGPIQAELDISAGRMSYVLGAFFLTYALFQVPVGALADRYGPRRILAWCVVGWSAATAATAGAGGFIGLLACRLLLGVAEAGAYPAATGLVRHWAAPQERGWFSSVVTLGGRLGGAVAPYLTGRLAVALAGVAMWQSGRPDVEGNWRAVLLTYGACGLLVAGLLWAVVRDRPAAALGDGEPTGQPPAARRGWREQLTILATSANMWLSGAAQFGTNLGWAFLVTLLPSYLDDVFHVPLEERGRMQSVPLVAGCLGMVVGGVLTDLLTTRLGRRWARAAPIGVALLGCGAASAVCPWLSAAWAVVAALSVSAFLIDFACPSIWAFNQDVGGDAAGAAAGWGNMWGNFGAALSPVLLAAVSQRFGWPAVFLACALAFLAAGGCGLLLDATRPLSARPRSKSKPF